MRLALLLLVGSCVDVPDRFVCDIDEQCVEDGVTGYCEFSQDCSFRDNDCDSGRRYSSLSSRPDACTDVLPGVSQVVNGGFEDGAVDGYWVGEDAVLELTDDAHTLGAAAKVCGTGAPPFYAISDMPNSVGSPTGVWAGRAWVKAAPGATEQQAVRLIIREILFDDVDGFEGHSDPVTPGPEWTMLAAEIMVIPTTVEQLNVFIEGEASASPACFLVDDVAIFHVSDE